VTGVELADNVLLPRNNAPIVVPLANLRQLPEELWQAVLHVITMPPVSDFLSINLSFFPKSPPLPELLAA